MDKETYQLLPKLPQFGLGLVPLNENTLAGGPKPKSKEEITESLAVREVIV